MNLIFMLAEKQEEIGNLLMPIMTLLGYLIWAIKVIVPVILIIVGMVELSKALINQDEKVIKEAQSKLIKKVIIAICIYLVVTLVGLIFSVISNNEWEEYTDCAFHPFNSECEVIPET